MRATPPNPLPPVEPAAHEYVPETARTSTFDDLFKSGLQTVAAAFQAAALNGTFEVPPLRELSHAIAGLVAHGGMPVVNQRVTREDRSYPFVHAVNVSILAACQAGTLGLQGPQIEEVCLAGLLHDIGRTRLPEAITRNAGTLSEAERTQLARHSAIGARMLKAMGDAGALAAIVAMEHHDRFDASQPPHLASQLVGLADLFDVVRSARPYDPKTGAQIVYDVIASKYAEDFHPRLLGRFGRLLGVHPAGSWCRLTSGEICEIVTEGPDDPLQPLVRVVDTAIGNDPPGTIVACAESGRRISVTLPANVADLTCQEVEDYG